MYSWDVDDHKLSIFSFKDADADFFVENDIWMQSLEDWH